MAGFLGPLDLRYIDGKNWELLKGFEYCVGAPDSPKRVIVPAGFVTDFASIPKVLWNILPPAGSYGKAAVIHDWLYRQRVIHNLTPDYIGPLTGFTYPGFDHPYLCTRAEADSIFREGMGVLNVKPMTKEMVYLGVRVGGWRPWGEYRRNEERP